MKKNILFLVLFTCIFSACEKDDFCIENPVTSKLIIDFYDDTNRETLKNVQRFSIISEGKTDSLFVNKTFNSISIPLNSLTLETIYTLKKNDDSGAKVDDKIAIFTIQYDTEEQFVSRSCGYIYNFTELNLTDISNNWIVNSVIINETVEDDSEHLKILH